LVSPASALRVITMRRLAIEQIVCKHLLSPILKMQTFHLRRPSGSPSMRMDSALNHPVAHLIEAHLAAYRHQLHAEIDRTEIKNARELVGELFVRMEQGISPTTADIAE